MKFIQFSRMLGALLILGPIAHHAYYIAQFAAMAQSVASSQGSANFPDPPTLFYAISAGCGVLLCFAAFFSGLKISLLEAKAGAARAAA